jgi:hypothetical protein
VYSCTFREPSIPHRDRTTAKHTRFLPEDDELLSLKGAEGNGPSAVESDYEALSRADQEFSPGPLSTIALGDDSTAGSGGYCGHR